MMFLGRRLSGLRTPFRAVVRPHKSRQQRPPTLRQMSVPSCPCTAPTAPYRVTTAQLDAVRRKYRAQSWPRPRRTASTESPGSGARVWVKRSSRCHGARPPHRQWWSRGPAFGHLKIDRPNCCCLCWLAGRDDRLPGDDRGRSPMAGFGQTWPPEQLTFGFTGDWNSTRAERGAASPCPTAGAQPCTRLPCPAHSASRNSTLRILPVAVLGSDSTISTWSGAL